MKIQRTKQCSTCKRVLPVNEFSRNRCKSDGLQSNCSECRRRYYQKNKKRVLERCKQWRRRNLEACAKASRKSHLMRTYGITPEDYDRMLAEQNGRCAICGEKETRHMYGKVIDLPVDHDHETSIVRGLLCHNCNVAIGHLKHSPELVEKAAAYLRRYRG